MGRSKRRSDRREDLVEAARRAMLDRGTGQVMLKEIAEEAGVTSGAVLYHFPDVQELLLAAHHAGMERFYELRFKAIESMTDPAEKLVTTVRSGLPTGPNDKDVRLLCELGGSAGRNPVHAALLTTLFDRQVTMYQGILESGATQGVFTLATDSLTIARTLVCLEDAYGYRITARHPTIDTEKAVELVLSYARLATGHELTG